MNAAFRPGAPRPERLTVVPLNAFPLSHDLELVLSAKTEDPADVVERRVVQRDLAAALSRLPEAQRRVLILRIGLDDDRDQERAWPQVAFEAGMTIHGVRKAFRVGMAALRIAMDGPAEFALAA